MTLIVEDGSIVADANSFVSLADARTLAATIGLTLPVDDDAAEITLINGGRYVNSKEPSLQGSRVSADQTMCFPRKEVVKFGFAIDDDIVPSEVICAQIEAAAAITSGTNPFPVDDGKEVQSQEVVGAVKRSFFESNVSAKDIDITASLNCLYPLTSNAITGTGDGILFSVYRG